MFMDFIEQTLNDVAACSLEYFGTVTQTTKDGDANQVLTEADLAIGQEIALRIRARFPGHAIVDEEAGYSAEENGAVSEYTWVIDPIDGTSNFAAGTPLFGIIIGLLKDEIPVAGGVALPALGELYLAEVHSGAVRNGTAIHVTDETDLLSTLVAYGIDSHREDPAITHNEMTALAEIVLNSRNIRSSNSVFDQMMVARGAYGACLNRSSKIWDNVGPALIIKEAGGVYTDFHGAAHAFPLDDGRWRRPYTWCTAPAALHAQLQEIIHRAN